LKRLSANSRISQGRWQDIGPVRRPVILPRQLGWE